MSWPLKMSLKRIWQGTDRASGIGGAQAKIDRTTGKAAGNAMGNSVTVEKTSGTAVKRIVTVARIIAITEGTAGRMIRAATGTGVPTKRIPRIIGGTGVSAAKIFGVSAGTDPITAGIISVSRTTGASTARIFRIIGNFASTTRDISSGINTGSFVRITAWDGTISDFILQDRGSVIAPLRNTTVMGMQAGITNGECTDASVICRKKMSGNLRSELPLLIRQ